MLPIELKVKPNKATDQQKTLSNKRHQMLKTLLKTLSERPGKIIDKPEIMLHKKLSKQRIISQTKLVMLKIWLLKLKIKAKTCIIKLRNTLLRPQMIYLALPKVQKEKQKKLPLMQHQMHQEPTHKKKAKFKRILEMLWIRQKNLLKITCLVKQMTQKTHSKLLEEPQIPLDNSLRKRRKMFRKVFKETLRVNKGKETLIAGQDILKTSESSITCTDFQT